jgi:hypothetical protein
LLLDNSTGQVLLNQQPNLFPEIRKQFVGKSHQPRLDMSRESLLAWKQRIFNYQQEVRRQPQPVQTSLFAMNQPVWDVDRFPRDWVMKK